MPQSQTQQLKRIAKGLRLTANRSHLPEGALLAAENVLIDRDGAISKARGLNRYGDALSNAGVDLGEFNDTLLAVDGTTIRYDSDGAGTWTAKTGSYTAPTGAVRIRFQEALLALYFTTDEGIKRLASLTSSITDAGMPQGLDIALSLTGVSGFLADNTQVGYRVLFVRVDDNEQEIFGADSFRETIANTAGASRDVDLTTTIPDGVVAGDFIEIYRTDQSASSTTDPGDSYNRVRRIELASGDITAGTITFSDTLDDAFLDFTIPLVTNPDQQGAAQEDSLPPLSLDVTNYKGHTFYSNTFREHQVEFQFLDTAGITTTTDTITITDGVTPRTYTFEAAENIGLQEFELFTGGVLAEDIRDTMKSFVRVVNRDTGNSIWYAYYISGVEDAPGKVLIRRRDYVDTALSVTATAGAGGNFQPALPTSGTSIATTAEDVANRLYYSKFEIPDSVPRANFFDIGTARNGIVRILPLRDSLIIMTERKVFRLSGEDEASFTIRELDPSTRIRAPESAVVLNNAVYAYTSQGVVRITENGVAIVSRPIEFELNKILEIPNFDTLTFGIAYEEERQFWLFTPADSLDTFPTVAWVFNFITNAWVQRLKPVTHGLVLKEGDRMFLAHAQDTYVLQERKSFETDLADFADEDIAVTIDAVSTTTDPDGATVTQLDLTYTYANRDFEAGFLVTQGSSSGRILESTTLSATTFRVRLDRLDTGFTAAAATVSLSIVSLVTWDDENLGDPSLTKQFSRVQLYMEDNSSIENFVGFSSDLLSGTEFVSPIFTANFGWGLFPWGTSPWGDDGVRPSTPIRVVVPRNYQRARAMSVHYKHRLANANFLINQLAIQVRVVSERSVRAPR